MICRSAVKPVFVGLGTAAILAAGGASAIADDSPTPSDPGTPAVGKLAVSVKASDTTVDPGQSVTVTTTVSAVDGNLTDVKVTKIAPALEGTTISGTCRDPFAATAGCDLGDIAEGESDSVGSVVTVPEKGPESTIKFTISVTVDAADVDPASAEPISLTYVVPTKSPTPTKTPTKSPTKKPTKKPTKSPSPSASSSSSSGTSSGGGSGSGGSSGSSGSGSGGYTGPSPNSSFDARNPQVALPPIQAPSPSVAPSPAPGSGTPQSRLQGNKAPVAQDLTFERMASTQIAWLAALLVAFSLLLTQVRLGRRRQPAGAPRRAKGTHRRPRHGMFGR